MSRKLNRLWVLLVFLVSGEVWALGLGDIKLDSALNQVLLAEIELISVTPDELANLTITVASVDTFARYGIDRPFFLSNLVFTVIPSGRTDGNLVRVTSTEPVTEPFVTFLVDAVWTRGRLLREYTLLLDPPTFAPPATTQVQQAVTAPRRAAPADSGRISRPEPTPEPAPRASAPRTRVQPVAPVQSRESTPPAPTPTAQDPAPIQDSASVSESSSFDTGLAGDFLVRRGDTLWGIASRVRQDNRLTINQTMLAIYEANPQAFAGNINILSAGATLRIPGADEVFRISRGDALSEVQRQHASWGGTASIPTSRPEPSLTLLPPDDDTLTTDSGDLYDAADLEPTLDSDQAAEDVRIRDIERLLAEHQDSLIEIGDNELTALRVELAQLRGEELPLEPIAEDAELPLEEEPDTSDVLADDADDTAIDDDVVAEETDATAAEETPAPRVVSTRAAEEPGIIDSILSAVTGIWGLIGGALLVVAGVLVWFAKRAARGDDEDSTGVWEALDADDHESETFDSTARLRALAQEDESAIVVVEQEMEEPDATRFKPPVETPVETEDVLADTGTKQSLEDTFSSDTAINLDQSDPVAEADFHMAYGLYDQAADLINGALVVEPERQDLLTKLCEIYFVWGNRDAFVDAATRLNSNLSGDEDSEWDKIVIMGQQIAADHELFADVTPGAATKAVDLSFEGGTEETSALDMDFAVDAGASDDSADDIIDLGAEEETLDANAGDDVIDFGAEEETLDASEADASSIDFVFDEPDTGASVTQEMPPAALDEVSEETAAVVEMDDKTIESPTLESPASESTVETPTIEQQFESLDPTGEMPSLSEADETEIATLDDNVPDDATAEIDLDDLGLDLESLAESDVAESLEAETELLSDLDDTAESQTLKIDDLAATGKNPTLDTEDLIDDQLSATGRNPELPELVEDEATGMHDLLEFDEALAATSDMPTIDDVTGKNPALAEDDLEDTDIGLDTSLLDATGQTQVLPEDFAVETGTGTDIQKALADDAETMLASLDDDDVDDGDFDFAKTEALPKDAFIGDMATDDTGVMPVAAGSTDMDLDLDDLTAALKVSAVGDTVNQVLDDATVEQPRPNVAASEGEDDDSPTAAIAPEDLSDDLHDARTMTEVGTKLDLARAYVDMGDPSGARSILEEVLDEGDESQRQQAQQLLDSLPT